MPATDMHSHYFPDELLDFLSRHGDETNTDILEKGGTRWVSFRGGYSLPIPDTFFNKKKRLGDMDAMGVDKAVISVAPTAFYYKIEKSVALEIARINNDWAAGYAREYPERIGAMATVPMQDMECAVSELDRCHKTHGMKAVEIAPVINGKMLDDSSFFPFYEYCEKQGILLYIHPAFADGSAPYDKYHGRNLVGYVQETNWAVFRLLFGGVFERFPRLKVLTSHGGGLFPYQYGRFLHGQEVRPECRENAPKNLKYYVGNIYFDTITHWTPALQFLCDNFGSDHVVLGTDYPYDMADTHPVRTVAALNLPESGKAGILHKNCEVLLRENRKNEVLRV